MVDRAAARRGTRWWAGRPAEHARGVVLRIRQYAYYSVRSDLVTAEEMAARIGLAADRVRVKGQPVGGRSVPARAHAWEAVCEESGPGFGVGEQVERLVSRLLPHQAAIRALVEEVERTEDPARSGSCLHLVRYLDDDRGLPDGWQHHLLGWHLTLPTMAFLVDTRAEVDADEYGQDWPWYRRPRRGRTR